MSHCPEACFDASSMLAASALPSALLSTLPIPPSPSFASREGDESFGALFSPRGHARPLLLLLSPTDNGDAAFLDAAFAAAQEPRLGPPSAYPAEVLCRTADAPSPASSDFDDDDDDDSDDDEVADLMRGQEEDSPDDMDDTDINHDEALDTPNNEPAHPLPLTLQTHPHTHSRSHSHSHSHSHAASIATLVSNLARANSLSLLQQPEFLSAVADTFVSETSESSEDDDDDASSSCSSSSNTSDSASSDDSSSCESKADSIDLLYSPYDSLRPATARRLPILKHKKRRSSPFSTLLDPSPLHFLDPTRPSPTTTTFPVASTSCPNYAPKKIKLVFGGASRNNTKDRRVSPPTTCSTSSAFPLPHHPDSSSYPSLTGGPDSSASSSSGIPYHHPRRASYSVTSYAELDDALLLNSSSSSGTHAATHLAHFGDSVHHAGVGHVGGVDTRWKEDREYRPPATQPSDTAPAKPAPHSKFTSATPKIVRTPHSLQRLADATSAATSSIDATASTSSKPRRASLHAVTAVPAGGVILDSKTPSLEPAEIVSAQCSETSSAGSLHPAQPPLSAIGAPPSLTAVPDAALKEEIGRRRVARRSRSCSSSDGSVFEGVVVDSEGVVVLEDVAGRVGGRRRGGVAGKRRKSSVGGVVAAPPVVVAAAAPVVVTGVEAVVKRKPGRPRKRGVGGVDLGGVVVGHVEDVVMGEQQQARVGEEEGVKEVVDLGKEGGSAGGGGKVAGGNVAVGGKKKGNGAGVGGVKKRRKSGNSVAVMESTDEEDAAARTGGVGEESDDSDEYVEARVSAGSKRKQVVSGEEEEHAAREGGGKEEKEAVVVVEASPPAPPPMKVESPVAMTPVAVGRRGGPSKSTPAPSSATATTSTSAPTRSTAPAAAPTTGKRKKSGKPVATTRPAKPNSHHASESDIILTAYSKVSVYEYTTRNVGIMRRAGDGWFNATHILKLAGYGEKTKRTKILERMVNVAGCVFEKVQGGFGRYQGTWIPAESAVKMANEYGITELLKPLFDCEVGLDEPPSDDKDKDKGHHKKKVTAGGKEEKKQGGSSSAAGAGAGVGRGVGKKEDGVGEEGGKVDAGFETRDSVAGEDGVANDAAAPEEEEKDSKTDDVATATAESGPGGTVKKAGEEKGEPVARSKPVSLRSSPRQSPRQVSAAAS
ncbi:transcriptional regulator swi6 [Podochytrium sp. JEL0797]|nr:transcriptional regulator swi6 [Podochytrium sp. JEL0797]